MRTNVYSAIMAGLYITLLIGLSFLQIVRHDKYRTMSEENRLRVVPIMSPRGTIYDRNSRPVVKDAISFNASLIYSQIKDKEALAAALSRALDISADEAAEAIKRSRKQPFTLTVIMPDIGIEKAIALEEAGMDNPGLILDVMPRRQYIYGSSGANMIGYLGYINRDEYKRLRHYGYSINDLVGRDGIESYYDDYLRGSYGGKQIEVDNRGREVSLLGFKEPVPGRDIYLSVDMELQKFCDDLMLEKRGAIVVMDPKSGAVIALASSPSFDPEIFVDPSRKKERSSIMRDRQFPLMNRSISGVYPPGSVFKMVVATAALDSGRQTEFTTFNCGGSFSLGRSTWKCWKEGGHGPQAMRDAIKHSCNVYFYNTGVAIGADLITRYASNFGFGSLTGIDLPGEARGIVSGAEWKRKFQASEWYKGDTVNYSIGQGYLACTPIQVARMVSVFANGGYLVRPHVVDRIEDVNIAGREEIDMGISPEAMKIVREGLLKAVNETGGTAVRARVEGVTVAGKTGTAQTGGGPSRNHGWFAGFAPYEDAKVAVVIFDEHGGKSGYYAAETAGKVLSKAKELGVL
ncbi:MAG: penicillin-binding protein 2 [Candidatus Omnitrophica bacterium]|nr:penicillin-binding protein 2 [Candidatus Omnitrophota bacterium]